MANLHVWHHVIHLTQSKLELGLVELIWAVSLISVATLLWEWLVAAFGPGD